MTGFVWLASYPKSGNTWMRAMLTQYRRGEDARLDLDALDGASTLHFRTAFDAWSGLRSVALRHAEIEGMFPDFLESLRPDRGQTPIAKLHSACVRNRDNRLLFDPSITAGAIYLVRHPGDVAVSYAHHAAVDLDAMLDRMRQPERIQPPPEEAPSAQLPQRIQSWSRNVTSWLDSPHRLLLVRYEDLLDDPAHWLERVVAFMGHDPDRRRLAHAVDTCRFDRLQAQERRTGFVEKAPGAASFFREGTAGGWRSHLSPTQRERLVGDHGAVMQRLGYATD